jgi:hypothetical protein
MIRLVPTRWRTAANCQVYFALAILLSLAATPLFAEVEVTLTSGASLVGKVSMDGKDVVVKIEDSELRVPLSEVDSITSVDAGSGRQARRLLLTALEARVNNDGSAEVIGLLAEAARLAPDDPHVAYWYASSLADAGYGQAANDVFTKKRDAIAASYPGLTEQLAERIKRRVEMEKMPPALVQRLDELNAALAKQAANPEVRQIAAVFRLVDQDEQPIERAAFQMQCSNGQDENLEPFDDGYFVYSFNRHRGNQEGPSTIDITKPGLESKMFELNGSSNRVQDAGTLVVQRYDEEAKRLFRIHVADTKGTPVVAAHVSIQAMSTRGNVSNHTLSGETDAEGNAEIISFPMKYTYRVQSEGFNSASGNVEVAANASEPKPLEVRLNRAIEATIRLAWEATAMQGGGKTTGESTIQVAGDGQQNQYGQNETSWLRPFQQKDRLSLQFVDQFFGYNGPFGQPEGGWVRVLKSPADANLGEEKKPDAATTSETERENAAAKDEGSQPMNLDAFNAVDLDDLDEYKSKLPQPRMIEGGHRTGPRPPMVLPAETGKIYVGRLVHREMRTGQPIQLTFKVFIEEMSTGGEADE